MSFLKEVKSFVTTQKNAGAKGLNIIMRSVDHMFEHGDSTPLAWLISYTDGRDSAIFRRILGEVTGGVTLKKDPKQPCGLRITMADNAGPSEGMAILRDLVTSGESFRGQAVATWLKREPKPAELDKYVAAVYRKIQSEGWTFGAFRDALSTMNANKVIEVKA
jgi:hypothetical protein